MQHMSELRRLLVSAHLVDARGKACPAPIIELVKALQRAPVVELWADDPAAWGDLHAFSQATGHVVEAPIGEGRVVQALVRRKPA
ncbi:MAG: sulfurtransferase TusA family protein [Archangium sp.]|nr:sulfurtransferase TusA family protein [Archangium sp.]